MEQNTQDIQHQIKQDGPEQKVRDRNN